MSYVDINRNYDDRYILQELNTSTQTWNVSTTGNDDTGDGSGGNPFATIGRAWREVSSRPGYNHNISLSSGTHNLDTPLTMAMPSGDIQITGATPDVSETYTIQAVLTNTRSNGLRVKVTGAPGWAANAYENMIIKWTSGAPINRYATVKENDADSLYLVMDDEAFGDNLPVNGDTFAIYDLQSTINFTGRVATHGAKIQFNDVTFTGTERLATQNAVINFNRCIWQAVFLAVGHNAFIRCTRSTFVSGAGTPTWLVACSPNSTVEARRACIFDGGTSYGMLFEQGMTFRIDGEICFKDIGSDGITTRGCTIGGFNAEGNASTPTIDFDGCANGFTDDSDRAFPPTLANVPFVRGTITGNYLLSAGPMSRWKLSGGQVTTALGTNTTYLIDGGASINTLAGTHVINSTAPMGEVDAFGNTTDATVTQIYQHPIAESQVIQIKAKVVGNKNDNTDRAIYEKSACFYRAPAGNVTQEGATTVITEIESNAAWNMDFAADVGNQAIDVQVTGVAATTINWRAIIEIETI